LLCSNIFKIGREPAIVTHDNVLLSYKVSFPFCPNANNEVYRYEYSDESSNSQHATATDPPLFRQQEQQSQQQFHNLLESCPAMPFPPLMSYHDHDVVLASSISNKNESQQQQQLMQFGPNTDAESGSHWQPRGAADEEEEGDLQQEQQNAKFRSVFRIKLRMKFFNFSRSTNPNTLINNCVLKFRKQTRPLIMLMLTCWRRIHPRHQCTRALSFANDSHSKALIIVSAVFSSLHHIDKCINTF
jgi:hypothetical protein